MSADPHHGGPDMPPLRPDEKLDVEALLEDLEHYRPRRRGWHWREPVPDQQLHKFTYKETSKGLERSVPLPAAHYFGDIDPQPDCVIPPRSPRGGSRTTSAACAWRPGTAPTT